MQDTILDLNQRLKDPDNYSAHSRLTKGILDKAGVTSPMALSGYEFNSMAERFYRENLKHRQIEEGLQMLRKDLAKIDSWESWRSGKYNKALWNILKGIGAEDYLQNREEEVVSNEASVEVIKTFIHLMLLTIHQNTETAANSIVSRE
jgi:hypothetical protein